MFGWDDSDKAHEQVYGQKEHTAKLSHELIGGAAAFEAMKLFEDHQRKQGKPVSHKFAKEAIAGLIGTQIERLAETKGMDEIDKIKAREHAQKHSEQMYDDHYVRRHGASEYDPSRYEKHESFSRRGW